MIDKPINQDHGRTSETGESARVESSDSDRSLPSQLAELTNQTIDLMRKELKLAKFEVNQKVDQVKQGVGSLAIGSLVLAGGLYTLLAAAVLGIGLYMPYWASALIVGGVFAVIGGAMLGKGRQDLEPKNLKPDRTIDELQRDKRLVEEHA